jgi:RNA polymerase sigma-70 factor, ECF subfamily
MKRAAPIDGGPPGPSDADIVRRIRSGDGAAFHQLVDRFGPALFGLAASLVGNAADAEDVVQETFSGAFRGLHAFRGDSSVKTWLTRILVRQVAAHLRGRKRAIRLVEARASGDAAAAPSADARMDVREAVAKLSPEHREVVVLREFAGLSYEEIAQVLDVPRGTVESRLFRARREMQELLKDYLP